MTQRALREMDAGYAEAVPCDVRLLGAANLTWPDVGGSPASLIENNDPTMPLPFSSCGG